MRTSLQTEVYKSAVVLEGQFIPINFRTRSNDIGANVVRNQKIAEILHQLVYSGFRGIVYE